MEGQSLAPAWQELVRRATADGGFADQAGGCFRPDAAAWAAVALSAAQKDGALYRRACDRLARAQLEDGRVGISPEHPEAFWPTPLAVLAWQGSAGHREAQGKAVRFLLNTAGRHWPRDPGSPLAHDTNIPGWPWTDGAHSWVEPTAMALVALKATGFARHPRVSEGIRLLLDRQLSGGGWNQGNTGMFGQESYPLAEYTGIALVALADMVQERQIEKSLGYLGGEIQRIRTPLSLGWGVLGLDAWARRPKQAEAWIAEAIARQGGPGQCRTSHLALLLVAAVAEGGLASTLSREKSDAGG